MRSSRPVRLFEELSATTKDVQGIFNYWWRDLIKRPHLKVRQQLLRTSNKYYESMKSHTFLWFVLAFNTSLEMLTGHLGGNKARETTSPLPGRKPSQWVSSLFQCLGKGRHQLCLQGAMRGCCFSGSACVCPRFYEPLKATRHYWFWSSQSLPKHQYVLLPNLMISTGYALVFFDKA